MQKSVGQPITRVDGRLKVTGRATYTAEQKIPNGAYGWLVMSTIAKGRIAPIDVNAAERLPGVLAILTHQNVQKLPEKPNSNDPNRPTARKLQLLQEDRI